MEGDWGTGGQSSGGAMHIAGTGTYSFIADNGSHIKFTNNASTGGGVVGGGAIRNERATLIIENAIFESNVSNLSAGIIDNYGTGTLVLTDVEFLNNSNVSILICPT